MLVTAPALWSPSIQAGQTIDYVWFFTDTDTGAAIDLRGYTVKGMARPIYPSDVILMQFDPLDLTSECGGSYGIHSLRLKQSSVVTSAMGVTLGYNEQRIVWDFELIEPNGDVNPLFKGFPQIYPEVTR